ncbi:hypothetical protein [Mycobacterium sp.]|uniref:hypothetical protein n=1 Tax=Mycobacterium sp. TaxID=1785 RepID=UPI0031D99576
MESALVRRVTAAAALACAGLVAATPVVAPPPHVEAAVRLAASAGESPVDLLSAALSAAASSGQGLPDVFTPFSDLVRNTSDNLAGLADAVLADPAPFLRQILINQLGYLGTVATSVENAGRDFADGLAALPAALQQAFADLTDGNVGGALGTVAAALVGLVFDGFDTSDLSNITIQGAIGDLLSILTIPGEIAQRATDVIEPLTDTTVAADISNILAPSDHIGLPVLLGFEVISAPYSAALGLASSGTDFVDAVQAGNLPGALGALVDAPATTLNGFLNGQQGIDIPIAVGAPLKDVVLNVPLGGLLAPLKPLEATANFLPICVPIIGCHTPPSLDIAVKGTPAGGLIPTLLTYLPHQLAAAIDGSESTSAADLAAQADALLNPVAALSDLGALLSPADWAVTPF